MFNNYYYTAVAARCFLLLFLLYPFQFALAQWTEQSPILQASDEGDFDEFGRSVSMSGTVAVIAGGGNAYSLRYSAGAWTEEQILQPSDSTHYLDAVAIDGNVIVAGAFFHPSGGTQCGQAYVFRFNGAIWVEEAILQASDEANFAWFGDSVGIEGNRIVIGAPGHPSGGSVRGQAYAFRYNGTSWVQESILQPAVEGDFAGFGDAVDISGTVAIIGATSSGYPGKAFAFRRSGTVWTQEHLFLPQPGEDSPSFFGSAVAVQGSVAMIGGYRLGFGIGETYVYSYDGLMWTEKQILVPSSTDHFYFGRSVAFDGDTAVIGAIWDLTDNRGHAYVFQFNGSSWQEEQILNASDPEDYAWFGSSAAIVGNTIMIGARQHPSGGTNRGQVYVYTKPAPNRARTWVRYH